MHLVLALSLQALVAQKVADAVPPGLGVAEIAVPAQLAAAGDDAQVALKWLTAPRAGTSSVLLVLRRGARELGRGFARVKLAPLRRVLVAARPLAAGGAVAAGDLAIETRATDLAWSIDPDALAGAAVLREVAAGAVVTERDVAPPPPVAAGTEVQVVVARGALRVAVSGILERPTRPGEPCTVRLSADHRILRGRLADRATVVNV